MGCWSTAKYEQSKDLIYLETKFFGQDHLCASCVHERARGRHVTAKCSSSTGLSILDIRNLLLTPKKLSLASIGVVWNRFRFSFDNIDCHTQKRKWRILSSSISYRMLTWMILTWLISWCSKAKTIWRRWCRAFRRVLMWCISSLSPRRSKTNVCIPWLGKLISS